MTVSLIVHKSILRIWATPLVSRVRPLVMDVVGERTKLSKISRRRTSEEIQI